MGDCASVQKEASVIGINSYQDRDETTVMLHLFKRSKKVEKNAFTWKYKKEEHKQDKNKQEKEKPKEIALKFSNDSKSLINITKTISEPKLSLRQRNEKELIIGESKTNEFEIYPKGENGISMKWYKQWFNYVTGKTSEIPKEVHNMCIRGKCDFVFRTKLELKCDIDYVGVSDKAWEYIIKTYGGGPRVFARRPNDYKKWVKCDEELLAICCNLDVNETYQISLKYNNINYDVCIRKENEELVSIARIPNLHELIYDNNIFDVYFCYKTLDAWRQNEFEFLWERKMNLERGNIALPMSWYKKHNDFLNGKCFTIERIDTLSLKPKYFENNSEIIETRLDAMCEIDYICISDTVWKYLSQTYGAGPKVIARQRESYDKWVLVYEDECVCELKHCDRDFEIIFTNLNVNEITSFKDYEITKMNVNCVKLTDGFTNKTEYFYRWNKETIIKYLKPKNLNEDRQILAFLDENESLEEIPIDKFRITKDMKIIRETNVEMFWKCYQIILKSASES